MYDFVEKVKCRRSNIRELLATADCQSKSEDRCKQGVIPACPQHMAAMCDIWVYATVSRGATMHVVTHEPKPNQIVLDAVSHCHANSIEQSSKALASFKALHLIVTSVDGCL